MGGFLLAPTGVGVRNAAQRAMMCAVMNRRPALAG
jgi:hypothetical protein